MERTESTDHHQVPHNISAPMEAVLKIHRAILADPASENLGWPRAACREVQSCAVAAVVLPPRTSAVPERVLHPRPVVQAGSGHGVDYVESDEEEPRAPVCKRRKYGKSVTSSEFVGVRWHKPRRKWDAQITHAGKYRRLGGFDDEREAARAVDTAARQLRGDDAHGGRAGNNWLRLNFPTADEVKRAKDIGALLTEEDKAAAAAEWEQQGPSAFAGVNWKKDKGRWVARISHGGKMQHLGYFGDEREAARAVDMAARRLRGDDAHGGRSGKNEWLKLNFPSKREAGRGQALGIPGASDCVLLRSCEL
jgi:hypothetical protein